MSCSCADRKCIAWNGEKCISPLSQGGYFLCEADISRIKELEVENKAEK